MTLTSGRRRFALTLHILTSVGWVGAVVGFLALALAGPASSNAQLARASYIAMDLTYRSVVVPLGLASLMTGVVSSLGTEWGLVRHYWVLVKLLMTVPAVFLMLVHVQPVERMAQIAATEASSGVDPAELQIQLVVYAATALLVLLVATALSTYKPRGKTPYATRELQEQSMPHRRRIAAAGDRPATGFKAVVTVLALIVLVFATVHLAGLHRH
jgi:hypothetical protein